MRVVLDANVVISFLLTRGKTISAIFSSLASNKFTLLFSNEILKEIKEVTQRLEEKDLIHNIEADSLLKFLLEKAELIQVKTCVTISPDKKDNRYLACAKDGRADYLVTGDKKHLLPLKRFGRTKILAPRKFVEILNS